MTEIYLVRHAEAEGNVFRRLQGQYDSFVTPNGRKQIAALAKRFENIEIDAVYSSDLSRTQLTASAIYLPKNLPLTTDRRFRELSVGIWENLPFGWLDHSDPERNRAFSHQPEIWHVEGSEHFETYTSRFLEAMEELAKKHDGQTIAIVSHGMVLRGILQRLFYPNDRNAVAHCENTAVTHLIYEDGQYSLRFLNDASHIPHEISTLGRQMWWRGDGKKDFNMWYREMEESDASLLQKLGYKKQGDETIRISMLVNTPTGALVCKGDELVFFGLLEEHRGMGLSAQLLGEAVSIARKNGISQLRIEREISHPAAKHMLENYGFHDGKMNILPSVL